MALPAILGALGSAAGAGAAGASAAGAASTATAMSRLATGLSSAAGVAKVAENGIANLTRGIGGLSSPVSGAVGVISSFREAVTSLGNQIAPFVEKANPAYLKRFQAAADDLSASIGRILIPIMEFATATTRGFADVIFDLGGPLADLVRQGFAPLTELIPSLTNAFAAMLRPLRPLIDLVGQQVRLLVNLGVTFARLQAVGLEAVFSAMAVVVEAALMPLNLMVRFLADAAVALNSFVERGIAAMRRLLGIRDVAGSSVGASARNAQTGSVEGFQQKAMTAAFGLGTASAEERTATLTDAIYTWLRDKLPPLMMEVAGKIAREVANAIPGAETARRTAAEIGAAGREAGRFIDSPAGRVATSVLVPGGGLLAAGMEFFRGR